MPRPSGARGSADAVQPVEAHPICPVTGMKIKAAPPISPVPAAVMAPMPAAVSVNENVGDMILNAEERDMVSRREKVAATMKRHQDRERAKEAMEKTKAAEAEKLAAVPDTVPVPVPVTATRTATRLDDETSVSSSDHDPKLDHDPQPSVTSVSEHIVCDNALPADREHHDDAVAPGVATREGRPWP